MTYLEGTGHPRRFGYAKCIRCGTMRPRPSLRFAIMYDPHNPGTSRVLSDAECNWTCSDAAWCSAQSGRLATLKTGLDPHGDAP